MKPIEVVERVLTLDEFLELELKAFEPYYHVILKIKEHNDLSN